MYGGLRSRAELKTHFEVLPSSGLGPFPLQVKEDPTWSEFHGSWIQGSKMDSFSPFLSLLYSLLVPISGSRWLAGAAPDSCLRNLGHILTVSQWLWWITFPPLI